MFTNRISKGTEVSYCGVKHIVENFDAPTLYLKRVSDGMENEVDLNEFQNNGHIIYDTNVEDENSGHKYIPEPLTEKDEKVVAEKMDYINAINDYWYGKELGDNRYVIEKYPELFPESIDASSLTQEKIIEAIMRLHTTTYKSKSSRQIKRYLQYYRDYERKGLDGKYALRGKTGDRAKKREDNTSLVICKPGKPDEILEVINVRLEPNLTAILKDKIENHYLTIRKSTVAELIDSVNITVEILNKSAKSDEEKIERIKDSTVYSIINKLDEAIKIRYKGTKKEVLNKVTNIETGFTHENGRYPLHIVAIDHQKLDVLIVDENGQKIGRPWITVGIDLYSRMIWGFHISFEEPSINKVIKVLKHGLLPKNTREEYDTKNDYLICGKPDTIMFDNGSDFKSDEIQRIIVESIGATVMYRPVRTPNYSGVVERFFGTLNSELIHRLSGTTLSNPAMLDEIDPEKLARYTLPEITKIITTFITDVYHIDKHGGLKRPYNTPMKAYKWGITMGRIPRYVAPDAKDRLTFDLMRQETRAYTGKGITFENVIYKSDEYIDIINSTKPLTIKYDDDDLSTILLLHPKTNKFVVVPAVQPSAAVLEGVNRYYYNWLLKLREEEMKLRGEEDKEKIPNDIEILEGKVRLQRLIDKKHDRSALIRKQKNKAGMSYTDTAAALNEEGPEEDTVIALLKEDMERDKATQEDVG